MNLFTTIKIARRLLKSAGDVIDLSEFKRLQSLKRDDDYGYDDYESEDYGYDDFNQIPGGHAESRTPADFCSKALGKGLKHEMEHTTDPKIATEIAMDHLTEDPDYYDKLEQLED